MDNVTIEAMCIDEGSYHDSSKWEVTLRRNRCEFKTTYTAGCGLRTWKRGKNLLFGHISHFWTQEFKPQPGKQVNFSKRLATVKRVKEKGGCWQRQKDVLDEFKELTSPIAPTVEGILKCLLSDAECVHGATFQEFCDDLGYDTDSVKSRAVFDGCRDSLAGLNRLGLNLDTLRKEIDN